MKYRNALPQLGNELFLTDGGLETTLVFHHGVDPGGQRINTTNAPSENTADTM